MAPLSSEDKISFLLVALRHSGPTQWPDVAAELGLKTNTASKRLVYITQADDKRKEGDGAIVKTPKKKTPKKTAVKGSSTKKQKLANGKALNVGDDDEEGEEELIVTPKPKTAKRPRSASAKKPVYKDSESEVDEEVEADEEGIKADPEDEA